MNRRSLFVIFVALIFAPPFFLPALMRALELPTNLSGGGTAAGTFTTSGVTGVSSGGGSTPTSGTGGATGGGTGSATPAATTPTASPSPTTPTSKTSGSTDKNASSYPTCKPSSGGSSSKTASGNVASGNNASCKSASATEVYDCTKSYGVKCNLNGKVVTNICNKGCNYTKENIKITATCISPNNCKANLCNGKPCTQTPKEGTGSSGSGTTGGKEGSPTTGEKPASTEASGSGESKPLSATDTAKQVTEARKNGDNAKADDLLSKYYADGGDANALRDALVAERIATSDDKVRAALGEEINNMGIGESQFKTIGPLPDGGNGIPYNQPTLDYKAPASFTGAGQPGSYQPFQSSGISALGSSGGSGTYGQLQSLAGQSILSSAIAPYTPPPMFTQQPMISAQGGGFSAPSSFYSPGSLSPSPSFTPSSAPTSYRLPAQYTGMPAAYQSSLSPSTFAQPATEYQLPAGFSGESGIPYPQTWTERAGAALVNAGTSAQGAVQALQSYASQGATSLGNYAQSIINPQGPSNVANITSQYPPSFSTQAGATPNASAGAGTTNTILDQYPPAWGQISTAPLGSPLGTASFNTSGGVANQAPLDTAIQQLNQTSGQLSRYQALMSLSSADAGQKLSMTQAMGCQMNPTSCLGESSNGLPFGMQATAVGQATLPGVGATPGVNQGNPFLGTETGWDNFTMEAGWKPPLAPIGSGGAFDTGSNLPYFASGLGAPQGAGYSDVSAPPAGILSSNSPISSPMPYADLSGLGTSPTIGKYDFANTFGAQSPTSGSGMFDPTPIASQTFRTGPVPTGDNLSSGFLTPERIGAVPIGLTPATLPAGSNPVAVKTTFESAGTPLYDSSAFAPIKEPGWGDVYLAKTGQKELSSGIYDPSSFVTSQAPIQPPTLADAKIVSGNDAAAQTLEKYNSINDYLNNQIQEKSPFNYDSASPLVQQANLQPLASANDLKSAQDRLAAFDRDTANVPTLLQTPQLMQERAAERSALVADVNTKIATYQQSADYYKPFLSDPKNIALANIGAQNEQYRQIAANTTSASERAAAYQALNENNNLAAGLVAHPELAPAYLSVPQTPLEKANRQALLNSTADLGRQLQGGLPTPVTAQVANYARGLVGLDPYPSPVQQATSFARMAAGLDAPSLEYQNYIDASLNKDYTVYNTTKDAAIAIDKTITSAQESSNPLVRASGYALAPFGYAANLVTGLEASGMSAFGYAPPDVRLQQMTQTPLEAGLGRVADVAITAAPFVSPVPVLRAMADPAGALGRAGTAIRNVVVGDTGLATLNKITSAAIGAPSASVTARPFNLATELSRTSPSIPGGSAAFTAPLKTFSAQELAAITSPAGRSATVALQNRLAMVPRVSSGVSEFAPRGAIPNAANYPTASVITPNQVKAMGQLNTLTARGASNAELTRVAQSAGLRIEGLSTPTSRFLVNDTGQVVARAGYTIGDRASPLYQTSASVAPGRATLPDLAPPTVIPSSVRVPESLSTPGASAFDGVVAGQRSVVTSITPLQKAAIVGDQVWTSIKGLAPDFSVSNFVRGAGTTAQLVNAAPSLATEARAVLTQTPAAATQVLSTAQQTALRAVPSDVAVRQAATRAVAQSLPQIARSPVVDFAASRLNLSPVAAPITASVFSPSTVAAQPTQVSSIGTSPVQVSAPITTPSGASAFGSQLPSGGQTSANVPTPPSRPADLTSGSVGTPNPIGSGVVINAAKPSNVGVASNPATQGGLQFAPRPTEAQLSPASSEPRVYLATKAPDGFNTENISHAFWVIDRGTPAASIDIPGVDPSQQIVTLSGQPQKDPVSNFFSSNNYLIKQVNSPNDLGAVLDGTAKLAEVPAPAGVTPVQYVQNLVGAFNKMPEVVAPYGLLGTNLRGQANSNNFATQLGADAGISPQEVAFHAPLLVQGVAPGLGSLIPTLPNRAIVQIPTGLVSPAAASPLANTGIPDGSVAPTPSQQLGPQASLQTVVPAYASPAVTVGGGQSALQDVADLFSLYPTITGSFLVSPAEARPRTPINPDRQATSIAELYWVTQALSHMYGIPDAQIPGIAEAIAGAYSQEASLNPDVWNRPTSVFAGPSQTSKERVVENVAFLRFAAQSPYLNLSAQDRKIFTDLANRLDALSVAGLDTRKDLYTGIAQLAVQMFTLDPQGAAANIPGTGAGFSTALVAAKVALNPDGTINPQIAAAVMQTGQICPDCILAYSKDPNATLTPTWAGYLNSKHNLVEVKAGDLVSKSFEKMLTSKKNYATNFTRGINQMNQYLYGGQPVAASETPNPIGPISFMTTVEGVLRDASDAARKIVAGNVSATPQPTRTAQSATPIPPSRPAESTFMNSILHPLDTLSNIGSFLTSPFRSTAQQGTVPTGCAGGTCVRLDVPCKDASSCYVSPRIAEKVKNLHIEASVQEARVTEAVPNTRAHRSPTQANGTSVDYGKAGGMTPDEIIRVIAAAEASGLRPVYEVQTAKQKNSLVQAGVPKDSIIVVGGWITAPHFSIYDRAGAGTQVATAPTVPTPPSRPSQQTIDGLADVAPAPILVDADTVFPKILIKEPEVVASPAVPKQPIQPLAFSNLQLGAFNGARGQFLAQLESPDVLPEPIPVDIGSFNPEPLVIQVEGPTMPTPPTRPTGFASNAPTPPSRPDDIAPAAEPIKVPGLNPEIVVMQPEAVPVVLADLTNPFVNKNVAALPGAPASFLPQLTQPAAPINNPLAGKVLASLPGVPSSPSFPVVEQPASPINDPLAGKTVTSLPGAQTLSFLPDLVQVGGPTVPTPPTRPTGFASNAPTPPSRPDDIAPSATVEALAPELPKPLILQPEEIAVQTADVPLPPSSAGIAALRAAAQDVAPVAESIEVPAFNIPSPLIIQPDIPQPIYANVPTPSTRPSSIGSVAAPKTVVDINRTLRPGSVGEDVSYLQDFLMSRGFGTNMPLDGIYGPQTAQAVRDFQRAVGVRVDGVFGPETRSVLREESPSVTPVSAAAPALLAGSVSAPVPVLADPFAAKRLALYGGQVSPTPQPDFLPTLENSAYSRDQLLKMYGFTPELLPKNISQQVAASILPPAPSAYPTALPGQTNPIMRIPTIILSDKEIDLIVQEATDKINAYWTDVFAQHGLSYAPVKVILYGGHFDASAQGGDIISHDSVAYFDPQKDIVYMDRSWLRNRSLYWSGANGATIMDAVGHEMAHRVVFLTGAPAAALSRADYDPLSKVLYMPGTSVQVVQMEERQADYLAGVSLRGAGLLFAGDPQNIYYEAGSSGDDFITLRGGKVPTADVLKSLDNPHGTGAERAQVSYEGLLPTGSVEAGLTMLGTPLPWVEPNTRGIGKRLPFDFAAALATAAQQQASMEMIAEGEKAVFISRNAGIALRTSMDGITSAGLLAKKVADIALYASGPSSADVIALTRDAASLSAQAKEANDKVMAAATAANGKMTPALAAALENGSVATRLSASSQKLLDQAKDLIARQNAVSASIPTPSTPSTASTPQISATPGEPLQTPVSSIPGQVIAPGSNATPQISASSPSAINKVLKWIEQNILGINPAPAAEVSSVSAPVTEATPVIDLVMREVVREQFAQQEAAYQAQQANRSAGQKILDALSMSKSWAGPSIADVMQTSVANAAAEYAKEGDLACAGFGFNPVGTCTVAMAGIHVLETSNLSVNENSTATGADRANSSNLSQVTQATAPAVYNALINNAAFRARFPYIQSFNDYWAALHGSDWRVGGVWSTIAHFTLDNAGRNLNDQNILQQVLHRYNKSQTYPSVVRNNMTALLGYGGTGQFPTTQSGRPQNTEMIRALMGIMNNYPAVGIASTYVAVNPMAAAQARADASRNAAIANAGNNMVNAFYGGGTADWTQRLPRPGVQSAPVVVSPTPVAAPAPDPALVQKKADLQSSLAKLQTSVQAAEAAQARAVALGETAEALNPTLQGLQAGKSVMQAAGEIADKVGNQQQLKSAASELSGKIDQMIPVIQGGIANPLSLMGSSDQLAQALKGIFASGKDIASRAEKAAGTEIASIDNAIKTAQAAPAAPLAYAPATVPAAAPAPTTQVVSADQAIKQTVAGLQKAFQCGGTSCNSLRIIDTNNPVGVPAEMAEWIKARYANASKSVSPNLRAAVIMSDYTACTVMGGSCGAVTSAAAQREGTHRHPNMYAIDISFGNGNRTAQADYASAFINAAHELGITPGLGIGPTSLHVDTIGMRIGGGAANAWAYGSGATGGDAASVNLNSIADPRLREIGQAAFNGQTVRTALLPGASVQVASNPRGPVDWVTIGGNSAQAAPTAPEGVYALAPGEKVPNRAQPGISAVAYDQALGRTYVCGLSPDKCKVALPQAINADRVAAGYVPDTRLIEATAGSSEVPTTVAAPAAAPVQTNTQTATEIPMLSVPEAPTHLYNKPGGQMSDAEIKQVVDYGARVGNNYYSQDYAKRGKTYASTNVNLVMRDQAVSQVIGADTRQPEQSGAYYDADTNTVWISAAQFKIFASKYGLTGEDLLGVVLHEIGHHVGNDLGLQPGMASSDQQRISGEAQANFFAAKVGVATGLFNERILQNLIKTQTGIYGPAMANAIKAGAAATDIDTSVQAFFKATPNWNKLSDLKIAQTVPVATLSSNVAPSKTVVPTVTLASITGGATVRPQAAADTSGAVAQAIPVAPEVSQTAQKPALIRALDIFDQITRQLMPFGSTLAVLMQLSLRNRKAGTLTQPPAQQQAAGDGVPPPTPQTGSIVPATTNTDPQAGFPVPLTGPGATINTPQTGFPVALKGATVPTVTQPGGLRIALRDTFVSNFKTKVAVVGGTLGGTWAISSLIGGIGGGTQSAPADAAAGTGTASVGAKPGDSSTLGDASGGPLPTYVASPAHLAPPAAPGTTPPGGAPIPRPQWNPTPGGNPSNPGMPSYTGYPDQSGYGSPMSPWQQQQMQQQQMQAQQQQAQQQAQQQQALQNLLKQQQQQQAQQAAQQKNTIPPTIQFSASPSVVTLFASTTLQWTSTNTTSCYIFDPAGNLVTQGTQSGSYPIAAVTQATTYGMTCTSYSYGQNTYATTTVMVATSTASQ